MKNITQGKNLIAQLEAAGFEAYYVGGCVRDAIMGRDGGDIDITTSALPEEVKEVFAKRRVIDTGIKHGTVTVLDDDGMPFEITTFRTDGSYSDNRHPDKVSFVRNIREDLQRRDFTINAIAMDIRGKINDPFGGADDIEAGIIRAVGDPDTRFQEDALRIMRAMRFASVLETGVKAFVIDKATGDAMLRNKELLRNVSAERIYVEFCKLVKGPNAGNVIREYIDVLGEVIPQILPMKGFDQRNPYHKYDILEHCIRAMENVVTNEDNVVYMKMAALFHDIGKPDTFFLDDEGIGHMYGHPARGEELVREIMAGFKADRAATERVSQLVKHHDLMFQDDEKLLKRRLNKFGPELLLEILDIKKADNIATGNMSHELEEKFDKVKESILKIIESQDCFSLKDLEIDGRDVLRLASESDADNAKAIKEGPWIGDVLNRVLEEVIDGKLANERDALTKRAGEIICRL